MTARSVISVEQLSKCYAIGALRTPQGSIREALSQGTSQLWSRFTSRQARTDREKPIVWALQDISFDVEKGDVVGIVGRNGAGKSTLLKILSRITDPTSGRAVIRGRVASLLEVGTGFHHDLTGRENTFLNGAILGMRREEIRRKFDEIVAFAEIEKFIDTPVKHYSSGMYMRLAFAVAAHLEPEILIVDEVLAVGDVAFQKKCLGRMHDVSGMGRTVLFVSHNMPAVRQLCTKGIWLKDGRLAGTGTAEQAVGAYLDDMPKAGSVESLAALIATLTPDPAFRLHSVELLQNNVHTHEIVNGLPLQIRIGYSVMRQSDGFHVVVELRDLDGTLIFDTLHNGAEEGSPTVSEGTYESTVTIPADFLAPMAYEIRIIAGIANVRSCIPEPVAFGIVVEQSGIVNRAYPGYRTPGKLAPLLDWDTRRLAQ
jgi:lipopolysaccharide transport system ATP-binding protein